MKKNDGKLFSQIAENYRAMRPSYPPALVDYVVDRCCKHQLAWDAATGSGQLAIALAPHFKKIMATDMSAEQLAFAEQRDNIAYRQALCSDSGLTANSIDCITVAQAAHWLDLDAFYKEVQRVAKNGCVISLWGYRRFHVNEQADALINHLILESLKDYWDPTNDAYQHSLYKDVYFPFTGVEHRVYDCPLRFTANDLINLINTYSASQKFFEQQGYYATDTIKHDLIAAFGGDDVVVDVKLPIYGKTGVVG